METSNADDEDKNSLLDEEPFDLDDLLPTIGEFGRYQKLLLWCICLPACIPCGFCAFNQLFMADTPDDYWCAIPELHNFTVDQRKQFAIPIENNNGIEMYSKCYRYVVDWKNVLENNATDDIAVDPTWNIEYCKEGWEFNKTTVYSSIVIDYNLVCDHDIYPTIGLAALNTGGPIGVYLFGLLNDRAGRRISYFSCLATLLIGSFLTAGSVNFWMWVTSRTIVGLTIPAVYQIPFIIALELVGPSYRSFVTVMTCTFYTFGIMMLAIVTYLERDWVKMCMYTSTPFLLYFLYILIMPESPRWLLAKGKLEEALKILEVMAKTNNKQLPNSFRMKLEERVRKEKFREKKKVKSIGALDLCKTPNMRLKTCLITLNWFANETVYLGLSYYGPALGNDQYLSFFLSSLVEIPSYLCCWVIMDRWGRRWPLCTLMVLSGITCIITVLIPEESVVTTLILFLISKSMISASYLIIYPFAGELYPTQVRGVGIGTSSYIGGMGLIVIPFITYLGKENLRLPLVVMGCISVIGGISGLRLPETLNSRLPQTLEEGEEFGKDWDFHDCFRCIPIKSNLSVSGSYEDFDNLQNSNLSNLDEIELNENMNATATNTNSGGGRRHLSEDKQSMSESTPLEVARLRRQSMKRLVRQSSTVDTQKISNGDIQLTHWI